MPQKPYRKTSQRDFLRVAEDHPVTYRYPGIFHAGAAEVRFQGQRITTFTEKLSRTMTFEEYDRLMRTIYVLHYRNTM